MKKTIICMGLGAGLMYLFDPEMGGVRRDMLKDKLQGVMPQTKDALSSQTDAVVAKASTLTGTADSKAAETIHSVGGAISAKVDSLAGTSSGASSGGTDGGAGSDSGADDAA